jgi:hypothetical protein
VQGCGPLKPSILYQLQGTKGTKLINSSLNTTHNPACKIILLLYIFSSGYIGEEETEEEKDHSTFSDLYR